MNEKALRRGYIQRLVFLTLFLFLTANFQLSIAYAFDLEITKENYSCGPDNDCTADSDNSDTHVEKNEKINYTVEYINSEGSNVTSVSIVDRIPEGTCYVVGSLEDGLPSGTSLLYSNDDTPTFPSGGSAITPTADSNGVDCDITAYKISIPSIDSAEKAISQDASSGFTGIKENLIATTEGKLKLAAPSTFSTTQVSSGNTTFTSGTEINDIDNDGDLDIIGAGNGGLTYIYKQTSPNTYSEIQISSENTTFIGGPVISDINGDSRKDIIYGGDGYPTYVFYQQINGTFTQTQASSGDTKFRGKVKIADMDNDGRLDIIGGGFNGITTILYRNANDTFTEQNISSLSTNFRDGVEVIDIDGDGDLDIVGGGYSGKTYLYRQTAARTYTEIPLSTSNTVFQDGVIITDIDGDGDKDIVGGGFFGNSYIYIQDGSNNFTEITLPGGDTRFFSKPVVVDIEGDGDNDIIGGGYGRPTFLFNQNESDTFERVQISSDSTFFYSGLKAVDIDDDGDIDLIGVGFNDHSYLYTNNNNGSFSETQITSVIANFIGNTEVTDINNDTHLDIIGGSDGGRSYYLMNNGTNAQPISQWKFDEGSGTTANDLIGNKNGTLTNDPSWVTGKYGKALSFDGTNDYVNAPAPFGANQTQASFSVWVNFADYNDTYNVFYRLFGHSLYPRLRIEPGGQGLHLQYKRDNITTQVTYPAFTSECTPGVWCHVVGTFDTNTGAKLYVNGVLRSHDTTLPSYYDGGGNTLNIGFDNNLSKYMKGTIDDLRVYNFALPESEISSLYSGGSSFVQYELDTTTTYFNGGIKVADMDNDGREDVIGGGDGGPTYVYRNTSSFENSGTYTTIINSGDDVSQWTSLDVVESKPANTNILYEVKNVTGNICGSTTLLSQTAASGGTVNLSSINASYDSICIIATLSTTDTSISPSLDSLEVSFLVNTSESYTYQTRVRNNIDSYGIGTVTSDITINPTSGDSDTNNNTDSAFLTLVKDVGTDLSIDKTSYSCGADNDCSTTGDNDSTKVKVNEILNYVVDLKNKGEYPSEKTEIIDEIPAKTCYVIKSLETGIPSDFPDYAIYYSNDDEATWTYQPVGSAGATDCNVSHIKLVIQGQYRATGEFSDFTKPTANGLSAYWNFNENTGTTANDVSGKGRTGTLVNGPVWSSGKEGAAITFDGTNDYVEFDSSLAPTLPFTFSTWVYLNTSPSSTMGLMNTDKITSSALNHSGAWVEIGTTGKIGVSYGDNTGCGAGDRRTKEGTTILTSGQWYHITTVLKGPEDIDIYVNGVNDGGTYSGTGGNIAYSGKPGGIGRTTTCAGGTLPFKGIMDEVKFFNRDISKDEVKSLFNSNNISTFTNSGISVNNTETDLLGYWKFDEESGITTIDSSGNNYSGTMQNGALRYQTDTINAIRFDGVNDKVDTGQDFSWTTEQSFSFSTWVKQTGTGNTVIFGKGLTGTTWEYSLRTSGFNPSFTYWNTSGGGLISLFSSTPLIQHKWHHIAITYNGAVAKMYLDGSLVATDNSNVGTFQDRANNLTIGQAYYNSGAAGYFPGFIDEFKVYNRALEGEEIWNSYKTYSSYYAEDDYLIGHWKLDEATGTTAIDSIRGNNGTLTSGPTWQGGKYGTGLNFDGTDDYVTMGDVLDIGLDDYSASIWFNTTDNNGNLISKSYPGAMAGRYYMIINGANFEVTFDGVGSSSAVINNVSTTGYLDGQWHHAVVTFDRDGLMSFYLDGVLKGTAAISQFQHVDMQTNCHLMIGIYQATTCTAPHATTLKLAGKLDDVRIYKKALSQTEVTNLYNYAPGPIAHYDLNENTGTVAYDKSNNNLDGTLVGGALWTDGKHNSGVFFDGLDDNITTSQFQGFSEINNLTLSTWVNLNDTSESGAFVKIGDNDGIGIGVGSTSFDNEGNDLILLYEGVRWIDTNTQIGTGWHHVAMVVDNSGIPSAYIDGKLINSYSGTAGLAVETNDTIKIGGYNVNNRYGSYSLDDVKVYNYARTKEQIREDMLDGTPTVPRTLLSDGNLVIDNKVFSTDFSNHGFNLGTSGIDAVIGTQILNNHKYSNIFTEKYKAIFDGIDDYLSGGAPNINEAVDLEVQVEPKNIVVSNTPNYGTIAQWKFDEGTGTSAGDSSGNASTGTLTNGPTWATGVLDTAVNFDGTNDYVNLASPNAIDNIPTSDFTLSAWLYDTHNTTNTWGTIFGSYLNGVGWSLRTFATTTNSNRSLYLEVPHTTTTAIFQTPYGSIPQNKWTHISVVWNSASRSAKLYINGKESTYITSTTGAGTYTSDAAINKEIGRLPHSSGIQFFKGMIDDVNIYNRALTPSEISEAYISAASGVWNLDNNTLETSGAAANGTLNGDTKFVEGVINEAAYFDGTGDYIVATAAPSQRQQISTRSYWIKPEAYNIPIYNYISNTSGGGTDQDNAVHIRDSALLTSAGKLRLIYRSYSCSLNSPGAATYTSNKTIPLNQWTHVTQVTDYGSNGASGIMKVYINGVYEGQAVEPESACNGSDQLYLMLGWRKVTGGSDYKGAIDDFKIYNRELTPQEISEVYRSTIPGGTLVSKGDNYELGLVASQQTGKGEDFITRSSFSTNAITTQLSGTAINDVFWYDTTTDPDYGNGSSNDPLVWRFDSAKSWYTETIDATYTACNIATHDRCGTQEFPEKVYIVATDSHVYIFDAQENAMWMRFSENGTTTTVLRNAGIVTGVYALNGNLYISKNNNEVGLLKVNYIDDSVNMFRQNGTTNATFNSTIGARNGSAGWTGNANAASIASSIINDIHGGIINGKTYIVLATNGGTSVLNVTDNTVISITATNSDVVQRVFLAGDDLYSLFKYDASNTYEIGVRYNIQNVTANISGTWPEYVSNYRYKGINSPVNPVLNSAGAGGQAFKEFYVTSGTSTIDGTSNSIYVANENGLTIVQEKQGDEVNGSVKYITKDYVSEEMIGDIRGMWSFYGSGNIPNNTFNIDDVSIKSSEITAKNTNGTGFTYVDGVRGKGIQFDGTDDYLCTDTNDDGTCDDNNNLDFTNSLSIGAWVKTTFSGGADHKAILSKYNGGVVGSYLVYMQPSGYITAQVERPPYSVTSNSAINDGNWHHILFTYDGSYLRLYLDGKLENSVAMTGSLANTVTPVLIGARYTSNAVTGFWNGSIDEPTITGTVLSADQIKNMYETGRKALAEGVSRTSGTGANANTTTSAAATGLYTYETAGNLMKYTTSNLLFSMGTSPVNLYEFDLASDSIISTNSVNTVSSSTYTTGLGNIIGTSSGARRKNDVSSKNEISFNYNSKLRGYYDDSDGYYKLYENDTEVGRTYVTTSHTPQSNNDSFTLGAKHSGLYPGSMFYGSLNSVDVWKTNLSGSFINVINADDDFINWKNILTRNNIPAGTDIDYTVYEYNGSCNLGNTLFGPQLITGMTSIENISSSYPSICLKIDLTTNNHRVSPSVNYAEVTYNTDTHDTFEFKAKADADKGSYKKISNNIEISGNNEDTVTENNIALDEIPFDAPSPDLDITKDGYSCGEDGNCTLENGLVGHWKLDRPFDGAGTQVGDETTNANHGTMTNGPTFTPGKKDNALTFDGINDYVALGNSSALSPSNISVSAWFKSTSTSTQYIIRNRLYGYGLTLNYPSAGKVAFSNYESSSVNLVTISPDSNYNDGEWHHVVGTYNGTTTKLYIDGILTTSTNGNGTNTIYYSGNQVAIGRDGDNPTQYFSGSIDDVRIYNRAITDNEARYLAGIAKPSETIKYQIDYANLGLTNPDGFEIIDIIPQGTCYEVGTLESNIPPGAAVLYSTDDVPTFAENPIYAPVADSNGVDCNVTAFKIFYPDLNTNLQAYWEMNENSWGTIIDSSGNGKNGTAVNGATVAAGKFGNAGSFDGSNDYVSITGFNGTTFPTEGTVAMWFKIGAQSGWNNYNALLSGNSATNTVNYFSLQKNGTSNTSSIRADFANSAGTYTSAYTSQQFSANSEWTHITVAWDKDENKAYMYINGVIDSTTDITTWPSILNNWQFGKDRGYSDRNFGGLIDDMRYYDRKLTTSEIKALYTTNPGLVGEWKMNEGTGTSANDSSISGNTGTLTNSPAWVSGKNNNALSFNGTNSYINLPTGNNIPLGNQNYTLSAWIKPTATGSRGIIGWGAYSTGNAVNAFRLNTCSGSNLGFNNYWWSNDLSVCTTEALDTNKWYHVVASYDGTTRKITLNGNNIASGATSGHNVTTSANFRIGSTNNAEYFSGAIDEVKILNYGLSDTEIVNLYNGNIDKFSYKVKTNTSLDGITSINNNSEIILDESGDQVEIVTDNNTSSVNLDVTYPTVISGRVWNDRNEDGIQDNEEFGINGITVSLYADANSDGTPDGAALTTTISATDSTEGRGYYTFDNLQASGKYLIGVDNSLTITLKNAGTADIDNNIKPTNPNKGLSDTITVNPSERRDNIDIGLIGSKNISGFLWEELNDNADYDIEDITRHGINGIELKLYEDTDNSDGYNSGDELIATLETDSNGQYNFDKLFDGKYIVVIDEDLFDSGGILEGCMSPEGNSPDVDDHGRYVGEDVTSGVIDLSSAQSVTDINFGIVQGTNDSNETPIILNHPGTQLTDFQISFTIDTLSLVLAEKMQSDCDDLRILDSDRTTQLSYWIESGCNSSNTKVWVKIPTIPNGEKTIYAQYGDPLATAQSNGNSTFEFFDDFNDGVVNTNNKWTGNTGNFSESSGSLNSTNNNYRMRSATSFTGNYKAITRHKYTTQPANGYQSVGFQSSTSNGFGILIHSAANWYIRNDSAWVIQGTEIAFNQWVRQEVKVVGTDASATNVGESSGTDSATATNSGMSGEYLTIGQRYDDGVYSQAYNAQWDWILVTKAAAIEPSITVEQENETENEITANCVINNGAKSLNADAGSIVCNNSTRSTPYGVRYLATYSIPSGATSVTTSSSPSGIAAGDEILIINLKGTSSNYSDVGEYDIRTVSGVSGSTISFSPGLDNGYDGTSQKIVIQRIPVFENLTICGGNTGNGCTAAATLTASEWDGNSGGILAFKVTNTLTVAGTITMQGKGYRGGIASWGGIGGETYNGKGGDAGSCAAVSQQGGGAGGYHSGGNCTTGGAGTIGGGGGGGGWDFGYIGGYGGGGGYGTVGQGGSGMNSGTAGGNGSGANGGNGGNNAAGGGGGGGTYGVADLSKIFFGSGGGFGYDNGGWDVNPQPNAYGGNGGGIIYIDATNMTVTGSINNNGGNSITGGAGAGGSIKITGTNLTLGSNLITAAGGATNGGDGGAGRIDVNGTSVSGTTNPTAN